MNAPASKMPIADFAQKAYLNYAMYVIMDRALPHIQDGLKPVQRRILYAMNELGLKATAKPKKCARTVGDVLGKYHPHGDSACYDAMVLMAQPFSCRYPLIDGQGNFGSNDDPKSFAAMRYTEARLSFYAKSLLDDLNDGATPWVDNFDGTLKEPAVLPARLPNILLNGTTGIAVGMATDIPPHNMREVVRALDALLKNPDLTLAQAMRYIKAPDFPTQAMLVTPKDDIARIYATGRGTLKTQARWHLDLHQKNTLVIDALPYQVPTSRVLLQIAKLMQDKKLPWVLDMHDESDDKTPVRLVLTLKPKTNADALMAYLYQESDLQATHRVNLNMIGQDGKPAVKGLLTILKEWLDIKEGVLIKRYQHHLGQMQARHRLLGGFLVAHAHLEEVIRIIQGEDNPADALMRRFGLCQMQANAVLEMKLRTLAKMARQDLLSEQETLTQKIAHAQCILEDASKRRALLADELKTDVKMHSDARKTPLGDALAAPKLQEDKEAVTVVLSQAGWIRVMKGKADGASASYRTGDGFFLACEAFSTDRLIVLDISGKSYGLDVSELPSGRGFGAPITKFLSIGQVIALFVKSKADVLLVGDTAYGFRCALTALDTRQKAGKQVLTGAGLAYAGASDGYLCLVNAQGYLLTLGTKDIPKQQKGRGRRLMAGDVVCFSATQRQTTLVLDVGAGHCVISPKMQLDAQGMPGAKGVALATRIMHKIQKAHQNGIAIALNQRPTKV